MALASGCGSSSQQSQGAGGATTGTTPTVAGTAAGAEVLRINLGAEPPSLDPGLATDTTSSNVLLNIMDPLVRLGPDLQPVPSLAQSWDVSKDGKTYTFHLRDDGRWTNGDPVTAQDFEWSWKRTISPQLAADYAYQFYGIAGAQAYNACNPDKQDCAKLRDQVGVKALDDHTLQVTLTSPQPWFLQQLAHHSFLAVNRRDVEQYGDKWTEAKNIVTDGPYKLTAWVHDSYLTLEKWDGWRGAAGVRIQKIEAKIIVDATTALNAFQANEIDACIDSSCIPPAEIDRLKTTPDYAKFPALGTYYYGINLKNVPDVNERRALAFAIDRQSIIDNVAKGDQAPALGFTPPGVPGYDVIKGSQDYLEPTADVAKAKALMAKVANPKTTLNLYFNDAPGHKEIAVAVQSMWKQIGVTAVLKAQEWAQYLQFLGPPPNDAIDVYRLGWIGDYVDAYNFLSLWTCHSGNNNTRYCDPAYDKLVAQAANTQDDAARYRIYAKLEGMLDGPDGQMPIIPIYWYTYTTLRRPTVHGWQPNLLDQYDFAAMSIG